MRAQLSLATRRLKASISVCVQRGIAASSRAMAAEATAAMVALSTGGGVGGAGVVIAVVEAGEVGGGEGQVGHGVVGDGWFVGEEVVVVFVVDFW